MPSLSMEGQALHKPSYELSSHVPLTLPVQPSKSLLLSNGIIIVGTVVRNRMDRRSKIASARMCLSNTTQGMLTLPARRLLLWQKLLDISYVC
eukprot:5858940-Amphidinium_carterae.1